VSPGSATVNGVDLDLGDGAAMHGETAVTLGGREPAEVLVFDLA